MGRSGSRVELAGCLEQSDKLNATPTNTRSATLPSLLSNTSSYFGNHPWGAPPGTRDRLLAPESKWISRSSQMDFSASSDCDFLASIFPDLWFLAPQSRWKSLICSCGKEGIVSCLVLVFKPFWVYIGLSIAWNSWRLSFMHHQLRHPAARPHISGVTWPT